MSESAERRSITQMLAEARARIHRYEPAQALSAMASGPLLIDIRSDLDRQRDGIVPGSLHIPRTVLEWRLDPDSQWRSPYSGGLDTATILLCDHGFSSSLAAASLTYLGFQDVGDVVGGFESWRTARLPTRPAPLP